jgi:hypothetical protein
VRRSLVCLFALLAVLSAACSSGGDDEASAPEDGDAGAEAPEGEGWTVLHYSMADTDLEPFMLQDVAEMAEVGSTDGLNVVALVDRSPDYTDEAIVDQENWESAKLFDVQPGSLVEIEDQGEVNMGDPQVLSDFIASGISENPAARYALIISDHGASWPGVGPDESNDHDVLDLAELRDGIESGLAEAGVDSLDLLGFDACLMATYEVASALAPVADYLLASSELEPGHGWDYRSLQVLADDPSTDAETFGRALLEGFQAQAAEQETDAEITLSLLDLAQMGALDTAMAEFSAALVESVGEVAPVVGQARPSTLSFGRNPDPTQDTHMADLGALVSSIGVESLQVSDQADGVLRALGDVVVEKIEGEAMLGATGLSIYFPPLAEYADGRYMELDDAGGWAQFLTAYYGAGDAIPEAEQPVFVSGDQAESFFDEDGFNLLGVFDVAAQDNLAEAVISYGLVEEDGSITYIGEEPGSISDDGSGRAIGIYDLTAFTISDGIDTAFAYLDLTFDEEAGIATIDTPLAYYPPGETEAYQDVLLSIVLDGETFDVLQETYYVVDDAGNYGELTADPEGIIVPLVLRVGADGIQEWVPTSDVGLFADLPSLQYDLTPLETGLAIHADLTVTDFGGNSATVSAQGIVP